MMFPKVVTALICFLFLLVPQTAAAEGEVSCSSTEVKVCFADGNDADCFCKNRDIDMSDTQPGAGVPTCNDEDDDGTCD